MSNVSAKKVFIQIESASEQQEHIQKQRKTLKVLQGVATDKENLTGRTPAFDRLSRLKALTSSTLASTPEHAKRKKVDTRPAETQTTPGKDEAVSSTNDVKRAITAEDLTSDSSVGPSEVYWERLAEKRREALAEALDENQRLHERVDGLEEELNTSRQMLEEARNLVEVLTEMLNEKEALPDADRSESETSSSTYTEDVKTEQAEDTEVTEADKPN